MNSGVYEIVNTLNGKRYVGSAVKFSRRWCKHRRDLVAGKHHSGHLQHSWNKHGAGAFQFNVLIICKRENTILYEQIAINALKPEFNISPTAGSCLGMKHRADAKTRQSALKGRKLSAEAKAAISAANTGRKHPPEFGAAISKRNTGVPRPKSEEHRKKLSEALIGRSFTKGIPKSDEHKATLSAARLGVPNPKNVGNKSRSGMKTDPQIVARQRAGLLASWAKRKGNQS